MDLFELPVDKLIINFDASATYFEDPKAPKRIKALIQNPKLVIFLMDPVKRAYFCIQVGINMLKQKYKCPGFTFSS